MRLTVPGLVAIGVFVTGSLLPADGHAAPILHSVALGTLAPGSYDLDDGDPGTPTTFVADNDLALFQFTLAADATITASITSHLTTPAGFEPILTLFEPGSEFMGSWDFLREADAGPLTAALSAGSYLLALTQYNNYFSPGDGAFDYDAAVDGFYTKAVFGGTTALACDAFVAPGATTSDPPECRTAGYAGTLRVSATVPEPAALSLVTIGASVLLARRRIRRRSGIPRPRPSS